MKKKTKNETDERMHSGIPAEAEGVAGLFMRTDAFELCPKLRDFLPQCANGDLLFAANGPDGKRVVAIDATGKPWLAEGHNALHVLSGCLCICVALLKEAEAAAEGQPR